MRDKNGLFPKIEIGFALKAFTNHTFNQDGNESAYSKIKYYNPPDLMFQQLPVKEKVRNIVKEKVNITESEMVIL